VRRKGVRRKGVRRKGVRRNGVPQQGSHACSSSEFVTEASDE
jgi:hypothetical protein